MKKTIVILTLVAFTSPVMAQKSTTTSAVVSFDATTPKDALPKAENKTVIGSLDKSTGALLFEAAVNNFSFPNEGIQKHFNGEKWMNSDQFPKFTFSGKIEDLKMVNFSKEGMYKINISGNLIVKGISKPIFAPATISISNGGIKASSSFSIVLADYGIIGGPIDGGKVAAEPTVTVTADFK
jgi:polyisoprenoid-binding protein YceI